MITGVDDPTKTDGSTVAVEGMRFDAGRDEVFAFVGPDGAGKRRSSGYRRPRAWRWCRFAVLGGLAAASVVPAVVATDWHDLG